MRISRLLISALLALAPSLVLAQGAPAPIRLPKGSTGPADGLTVGGTAIPAILGSKAGYATAGTWTAPQVDQFPDAIRSFRNINDPCGAFIGASYGMGQFGIYNPGSSACGSVAGGAKRSVLGIDPTGKFGTLTSNFATPPTWRNILDDGQGNGRVSGSWMAGSGRLTEIGAAGASLEMRQNGADTSGGTSQWSWNWGGGKALTLAQFDANGAYLGYPLYVTQPGKDVFGNSSGVNWSSLGTNSPLRAYNSVTPTARMAGYAINDFTSVNNSSFAGGGNFFKYFSSAADGGFDVGVSMLMDVAPTAKSGSGGTSTYYTESSIIRCPRRAAVVALSLSYSCAQAEHNVVNLDNDYGFISALDVATPRTGMMLLVPESFDGVTQHVGYDISYGIAFGRSGDTGANGNYVRTHTALLGAPNAISPGDGRFIYATGAKAEYLVGAPTSATSPYAFAQVDGAWQHGLDFTKATLFGGDAVHLADGQSVALSTDGNTKIFYEASSGKVVITKGGVRVAAIDGSGNMTIKGTLTQNGSP